MEDIKLVIKMPENIWEAIQNGEYCDILDDQIYNAIKNGTPLTLNTLADTLMEERIRGKLDYDTTFEKDIIPDVKCRLTVSIRDHRPCYCGAELREVWRESEVKDGDSEIKPITNAKEAESYPINANIIKGFEEFTKMMFKQGQAERESQENEDK